ncbi:MAG TPA: hypothetical protein EYG85_12460 [Crocinitomix sp.]|nr:hypothetical protein [Crocinitomix sp.]
MKKVKVLNLFLFFSLFSFSQINYSQKGNVELGLRTTSSVFGRDPLLGLGTGGQARVQLLDYLNTEWYADWITIDLNGAGTRQNAHIGWSVLFYPKKMNRFVPYVIAGHCFDYAKVIPLSTELVDRSLDEISRWSSAVQMGVGSHYYLTDRFNITFSAQYMLHLGKHLEYELIEQADGTSYLDTNFDNQAGERFEGHILLTFSLNYRIGTFFGKK